MVEPEAEPMNWREHVMSPERRDRMLRHRLVSAKVAAGILGVTSRRVLQMAREGKMPYAMIDDGYCGQFVFVRTNIQAIARGRMGARAAKARREPAAVEAVA
jgi:hypothetical protein